LLWWWSTRPKLEIGATRTMLGASMKYRNRDTPLIKKCLL
jgi:hypothetical protein